MVRKSLVTIQQFKLFTFLLDDIYRKTQFYKTKTYIQHGNTTIYEHSIGVALFALKIANFFNIQINEHSLIIGALLHDYFLYDWHNKKLKELHGFNHPRISLENAQREYNLSDISKDIILHHMFPLTIYPPKTTEGKIVCLSDKICSILEIFLKREKVCFAFNNKKFILRKMNESKLPFGNFTR